MATTSSGFTPLCGSLPVRLCTSSWIAGHPRRPADEDDVVDVGGLEAGVLDGGVERPAARVDQVGGQLVELGPRQFQVEVLRALGRGGDEGQVDLGVLHRGQLDLGLLGGLLESLHGHLVLREVDALGVLELGHQPLDDLVVPVVTAELGVARGGLDLEDALADLEHRDVEGPAAQVEDEDGLVGVLLVEPVGQRGGRRLVDDAQHLEAGDGAGFLGRRALRVVEVRGHGDDRLGHGVAEIRLGVPLQLAQDAGRDLLRLVGLAVDVDGPVGPHVPLHGADGPVRVGDGLALGHLADEDLAGLGEAHHRRGGTPTLGVRDHDGLTRLQHTDHRVGGSQVDSYGLGHVCLSFPLSSPSASSSADACVYRSSSICSAFSVAKLSASVSRYLMKSVTGLQWSWAQRPGHNGQRCYARRPRRPDPSRRISALPPDPPTIGCVLDLVLLRHGQSTWNAENLFTGWVDVDLTPAGEAEARAGGELLAAAPRTGAALDLRVLHTSVLTRAIRTAEIALAAAGRSWLPVRRDWRLNERHYGDLQGKNKAEIKQEFGEEQFMLWRRSYDTPPPPLAPDNPYDVAGDPRYRGLDPADLPAHRVPGRRGAPRRALLGVGHRARPAAPRPRVAAPSSWPRTATPSAPCASTSRSIADDVITELEVPTGIPYRMLLDDDLAGALGRVPGRPRGRRRRGRRGGPPGRRPPRLSL